MAIPLTRYSLEKLESIYQRLGFKVRYEKGNFKTGACMLENSRIIVVNKFANVESRVLALAGLISGIPAAEELLDEKDRSFYHELKQTKLEL